MEQAIVWTALAFTLLCLWLVLRNDLIRWRGIGREVLAEVIGHRTSMHDSSRSYAPIYRFTAEGGTHEVVDQVYSGAAKPPVGTVITLHYPFGRPDLARPPRPLMWLFVYAALMSIPAILIAKLMGWLPD